MLSVAAFLSGVGFIAVGGRVELGAPGGVEPGAPGGVEPGAPNGAEPGGTAYGGWRKSRGGYMPVCGAGYCGAYCWFENGGIAPLC